MKQISCDLEGANYFSLDSENQNTISGLGFFYKKPSKEVRQASNKKRGVFSENYHNILNINSLQKKM